MSSGSEQDRVRELAERVARRLAEAPNGRGGEGGGGGAGGDDLAALRASLSEIQRRLAHIESHIAHAEDREHPPAAEGRTDDPAARGGSPTPQAQPRPTWLSGTYVPATSHPSQEQFAGIGEAVSELVEFFESEKSCTVEPGGKPCDHCGMCSARGF